MKITINTAPDDIVVAKKELIRSKEATKTLNGVIVHFSNQKLLEDLPEKEREFVKGRPDMLYNEKRLLANVDPLKTLEKCIYLRDHIEEITNPRHKEIVENYLSGSKLVEIGEKFKISKQRIHQIISLYYEN